MDSVNSSLLESESVFIQVKDEDEIPYIENCDTQICDEDDCAIASKPIQLTHEEAMRLLHIAASLLQAHIKRYFQQRKYKEMVKERDAATKIQATWRSYFTRCRNLKVFRVKQEYIVNKLQKDMSDTNERFRGKIELMNERQSVLVNTLIQLWTEFENFKLKHSETSEPKDEVLTCDKVSVLENGHISEQFKASLSKPVTNDEETEKVETCLEVENLPFFITKNDVENQSKSIDEIATNLALNIIYESICELNTTFDDVNDVQSNDSSVHVSCTDTIANLESIEIDFDIPQ